MTHPTLLSSNAPVLISLVALDGTRLWTVSIDRVDRELEHVGLSRDGVFVLLAHAPDDHRSGLALIGIDAANGTLRWRRALGGG